MSSFSFLLETVRGSLIRCGVPARILVGLSGGADSVALLQALHALREEKGLTLYAAYVNHGLREDAEKEEAFCADLCHKLQIPFSIRRVQLAPSGSVEAEARACRYAALRDVMRETGAETLALAHHMDDQAETVLMHLMYGAGSDGLSGMAEYRKPLWRPLLTVRRADIREALNALGQSWCEDESNDDPTFTRNYIRSRIVPDMERAYPRTVEAIARAAAILREEDACLDAMTNAWLEKNSAAGPWPFLLTAPLCTEPMALKRRILRAYAARYGLLLEFSQVEELIALLNGEPGGKCNLPQGWRAQKTKERLHFVSPEPKDRRMWQMELLKPKQFDGKMGDGKIEQAVPGALLQKARLRTRQPGDRITPFGMRGSMKLKDYMISRDIDQPFRDDWPLLCADHEVLWVIGVGVSEKLRITETDDAIMLAFAGKLPDAI